MLTPSAVRRLLDLPTADGANVLIMSFWFRTKSGFERCVSDAPRSFALSFALAAVLLGLLVFVGD